LFSGLQVHVPGKNVDAEIGGLRRLKMGKQALRRKERQAMHGGLATGNSVENTRKLAGLMGKEMSGASQDGDNVFKRVNSQLKARLGNEVYSSWFGRMKLAEISKGSVRLSVPTAFLRSWINGHYLDTITELWKDADPSVLKVEIIVRSATRTAKPAEPCNPKNTDVRAVNGRERGSLQRGPGFGQAAQAEPANSVRQSVIGSPLDSRFTFENFVEGPSNRVPLAAARSVAEQGSGAVRFNPLFIHASVGLGKTHLLQAIAAQALRGNPQARVVYLTAEYFMWRFATAIRDNNALTLKEQLRDIDLLVIDDMQFLQGKSIQHEFCHLINMLLDSAKQVVVAADRPPSKLESLEPRVRSRLMGGVALEMHSPEYEMRLEMLKQRLAAAQLEDLSLEIPLDILEHIARTVAGSGRELEGAFNQLLLRHSFEPSITLERVDEFLGHICRSGEPKRVRIEEIQRIVARHYNVSKSELLSNRRTRTIVRPRQIAMYLAKALTPRSLPEIGRRFGGRDHTTVLHAVRKIEGSAEADSKLSQELELLKRLINDQA
jgi:chromosomal replication initiator protein